MHISFGATYIFINDEYDSNLMYYKSNMLKIFEMYYIVLYCTIFQTNYVLYWYYIFFGKSLNVLYF